jgi:AraC family transcriptional regulator
MKQLPQIKMISEKKLVGKRLRMSLATNRTFELWRSFMPERKNIKNPLSPDLYSLQVYDSVFNFKEFDVHAEFDKWALVEIPDFNDLPAQMEPFTLSEGMYAVFPYKGLPTDFSDTFNYIFNIWLPQSEYQLDQRPHFEKLGEKYKNNDPDSEEEIWIPIRKK